MPGKLRVWEQIKNQNQNRKKTITKMHARVLENDKPHNTKCLPKRNGVYFL